MSPEKSLWLAVIEQAIADHETILKRIKGISERPTKWEWEKRDKKDSLRLLRRALNKLKREMSSKWFATICDNVDIHQDHILGLIKKAEIDAGLAA